MLKLPSEILCGVLDWIIHEDQRNSNHSDSSLIDSNCIEKIQIICSFELISFEISKRKEIKNYLENNFWKPLLWRQWSDTSISNNVATISQKEEIMKLLQHKVQNSSLTFKRVYALTNHYKYLFKRNLHQSVKSLGVGKSSITYTMLQRLDANGDFDPTVEDYEKIQIEVNSQPLTLEIVDTQVSLLLPPFEQFIQSCDGLVLVCSVIDRRSFTESIEILKQFIKVKKCQNFPLIYMIHKVDLITRSINRCKREVTVEMVDLAIRELGLVNYSIHESTIKIHSSVKNAFHDFVVKCRNIIPMDYMKLIRNIIKKDSKVFNDFESHQSSSCTLM
ncbi:hypothetical protein C9374_003144 [Naegleria lovaniensis]|uniref:Uncharacterized protein n=1 Tax=Naegleria lovaniensis TaxID=51637 RepID=A0AA88GSE0_NAELO|nr:uncharacterized protein C9374_003144 [Naegleria lovaniensis]KAG2385995.1 hypothetical protein C9374_003144 [Naegleria lovaniensis]